MANPEVRALAQTINSFVAGLGHVYDLADNDPTPDVVTIPANGKPVVVFVDPVDVTYDTEGTQGYQGETCDHSTILMLVIYGTSDTMKLGTLQQIAAPFVRFKVKDAIRQHNTLGGAVYRAVCTNSKTGPFGWGGKEIYATRFNVEIDQYRDVTPGSF